MITNRDACMEIIFGHEGGYVNHPNDPGGPTNMGITHKTLAAWRGVRQVTPAQVKALGKIEAREIYDREYWDPVRGDALPVGVDLVVFDMGVNAGVSRSARMLQEIVGVTQDGVIGAQTLEAVRRREVIELIEAFSKRRLKYYRSLKTWGSFGRGWTRRTEETQQAALDMVRQKPTRVPSGGGDTAKARETQVNPWKALMEALLNLFRR